MRSVVFSRLHGKLIAALLLVMLIPILEIGTYGYWFTRREFSEQALARSEQEVYLQAGHIVASLTQTQGDALLIRALPSLESLRRMREQSPDGEQVARWQSQVAQDFLVLLSVRPMYQGLRYIDRQGMEILRVYSDGERVTAVEQDALRSRSDEAYFQRAAAPEGLGVFVSGVTLEDAEQDPFALNTSLVHFAMRLADGDGIVVIDVHAGWLLRNLPQDRSIDTWALVDHRGVYLAYPDTLTSVEYLPNGLAAINGALAPVLDGDAGYFVTGSQVVVYTTIFPTAGTEEEFWVLYRNTPSNYLYAHIGDFLGKSAFFLAGAAALALGLALMLGRGIVSPVIDLERMAVQFGEGGSAPDLPTRLPSDEIGRLTRSFHLMAHELERKRREAKTLIERLITAQEEERKRVAYDLHDGLIQQMVGARFYLTTCHTGCAAGGRGECMDFRRGCDALSEAIVEGRRIIEGLRPAALDDLGLEAALAELAEAMAVMAGWTLRLEIQPLPTEPDKTAAVTCYRIVQEALNNVRKHARASHVTVALHAASDSAGGMHLLIQDDGIGFDIQAVRTISTGFGLKTIRERAGLLGGMCTIISLPQHGTTIRVWIPQPPASVEPPEAWAVALSAQLDLEDKLR